MSLPGDSGVFEELLRKRGVRNGENAHVEREILERFQDHCAVLVLDSSGFTRLTQKYGIIHFLSLVVAMRDIVRPLFREHDALAYWGACDNLFAVFPTSQRAVLCALEAQRHLGHANALRGRSDRLEVAIGIGAGKLLRIGAENVYGDAMNLACKLGEDIAEPGEVLVTDFVYNEVKDRLSGTDVEAEPRRDRISGVELDYYCLSQPEDTE